MRHQRDRNRPAFHAGHAIRLNGGPPQSRNARATLFPNFAQWVALSLSEVHSMALNQTIFPCLR